MRALLLLLAIAACSSKSSAPDFVKGNYPGFSLDVPKALGSPPANADYQKAAHEARANYAIDWMVGALPGPEQEAGFVAAIASEAAPVKIRTTSRIRVASGDAFRVDFASSDPWSVVIIGCGVRTVRMTVRGTHAETTLQRMLSTFACTPDPAKERALADTPPVGIDDPALLAGWHREPAPANTYLIVDGTGAHSIVFSRGEDERTDVELMRTMMADWKFSEPTEVGGRHMRDLSSPAGEQGMMATWSCGPKQSVIALAFGYAPAEAGTMIAKFRCPKPGDKPLAALVKDT